MKARMCALHNRSDLGVRHSSVGKAERVEEMQQCFSKLKQIVPTMNSDQKLSKVQLLQHVIDYIMDLELTLQYQQSERRPLCENNYLNSMATHLEAINLRDCEAQNS